MTPYERLMAEQLPTGTFGHARLAMPPGAPSRPTQPWTPEEQAAHYAQLADAIGAPHLRLIANQTAA